MLLTNRRHRILFAALAGLEVAWFLPFALTLFAWMMPERAPLPALVAGLGSYSPLALFGLVWGLMLLYLLCIDLLNRWQIHSPLHEFAMLGIVLGTALLLVRFLVFPALAPWDLRWLLAVVSALFEFAPGSTAIIFLLVVNFFLWIRVATATDRALTFFSVGVSFRLGMLLSLVGNILLILVARQPATAALTYFWLFFGFGLLAVALARIDEKAMGASQSTGATLPWGRFGQLLVMIGITLATAMLSASFYTPTNIKTVLGWFSPLWNFLGTVFLLIFHTLFWLLIPILERIIEFVRGLLATLEPPENLPQELGQLGEQPPITINEIVQNVAFVRYCMVAATIMTVIILLLILFARTRKRGLGEEQEQTANEGLAFGGNPLDRLRGLGRLFRRYGLGPGLLAAISVQNIYANVCRLAGRRGYARLAAQSPDEYLTSLRAAFPGQEDKLARLTAIYMRVHYGDRSVDDSELAQLREDYSAIQATPVPAAG